MALSGAMSTGISGMKAQMDALNVVGNNVANVNTYGYKPGRVTFRESIYSTEAAGSNGNDVSGGTNPRQIGYGCNISTIDLDMSSMNLEPTGVNGDVAIQGDGFFLVGEKGLTDPESMYLSRYGDFKIDADGYLTDGRGNVVYGFITCNMNADGTAQETTSGLNGTDVSTKLVPIRLPLAATGVAGAAGEPTGAQPGDAIYPGVNNNEHIYDTNLNDYSCITYANLSIGKDGKITCTNGTTKEPVVLGYIALATVTNPNGLTHMSDSYYQAMEGCGEMSISAPGGSLSDRYLNNAADGTTGEQLLGKGGADLMPGFLEASGTDLATEFANMIIYQRGYQANTRIITVTDSMLEELVNIKR